MRHKNISVSEELKERLDKLFYTLKLNKKVETWDDFINLLFEKYKVRK